MGRPIAKAPRGRVLLAAAAERAGVSYATAYRRTAVTGEVPHERDDSGVVTIARRDVRLLARRPAAETSRRAIQLRPDLARYAAWKRAAGDRPVSTWLAELADLESGVMR